MEMINTKVRVYKNLHKDCYSIQDAKTRKVIGYAAKFLLEGVEFKVSEAMRQKVIETGQKNVHAMMEGTLIAVKGEKADGTPLSHAEELLNEDPKDWFKRPKIAQPPFIRTHYHPYNFPTFFCLISEGEGEGNLASVWESQYGGGTLEGIFISDAGLTP